MVSTVTFTINSMQISLKDLQILATKKNHEQRFTVVQHLIHLHFKISKQILADTSA